MSVRDESASELVNAQAYGLQEFFSKDLTWMNVLTPRGSLTVLLPASHKLCFRIVRARGHAPLPRLNTLSRALVTVALDAVPAG